MKLFSLLAGAIGVNGLKATATGNLPRRFCQEAAKVYSEAYPDKALVLSIGINTEPDFLELHTVRLVAEMAGLIRKYKGRFILSKKCRLALEEGEGGVYLELFRTYAQTFNWAYSDGYPDLQIVQRSFLYSMYLLHKYGEDFRSWEFYSGKFIKAFPMVLDEVPEYTYGTKEENLGWIYALRSLERFAEFFGLVDIKVLSRDILARNYEIKRNQLFDELVTFRV